MDGGGYPGGRVLCGIPAMPVFNYTRTIYFSLKAGLITICSLREMPISVAIFRQSATDDFTSAIIIFISF